ncbi:N-acetylmuramoyl-L-alanine amidase, partial [Enterobacter hormaechei]|nr:N-acetylmuramoyl-L-alanine amidase [Enterobacter hormaechei]
VSAHYLVDRDGTVYQLLPDTFFARHIIGLNYMAIGVENVGGPDAPLTEAQGKANAALVKYLCSRHKIEY